MVNRLGAALAGYATTGDSLRYDGEPIAVRLPGETVTGVRVGLFQWDLEAGTINADGECCAILGVRPGEYQGPVSGVIYRVLADDRHELEACVEDADRAGRVLGRRFRVLDRGERPRSVELWGRVVRDGTDGAGPGRLVGVLIDVAQGAAAAEAVERLPDGVFSLDQDGRLTYANRRLEELLHTVRDELLGCYPWDVVPWLSDPAYEDRYRSAMLSQEPTSFLARDPAGESLVFHLFPDVHGLTGRVVPAGPPGDAEVPGGQLPEPPAGFGSAATGPGALYHIVHMASVLTEAVTVGQVCDVVVDQLLPLSGGREMAVYVVRDRRMFLARQSGYPDGFLDEFEGVALDASLPGVQALTHGVPMFFESPRQLLAAYPGIPLDEMSAWAFVPLIASGRQVGSCILGFDRQRVFGAEERASLTALGGLVAQALERARLFDMESALARGLQRGLLPRRFPEVPGMAVTARYLPGTQGMEIGGDWYDVLTSERGVALCIGDVEGHNVAAAAVMGQLRSAVAALAGAGLPPQEVMRRVNRQLADAESGLFASCCYVEWDRSSGEATMVRAGHLPPVLCHPDGRTEVVDAPGGILLGVLPDAEYPALTFPFAPGDLLALYTDGLVEEPGEDVEHGIDALRTRLAHTAAASLDELADRLVGEARRATDRPDDIALLLALLPPRP
ncbi:SpoIIE family protein phosphatase [Streptomyces durbertensis]|uniref:SpoIIE family protein phosphatase n=1 Tax=Streptomyces durbertensis TaxID=2448886 RepID=UPI002B1FC804|nr:SpoIIE family protein phosphatase [Streptomyces durbertensis]